MFKRLKERKEAEKNDNFDKSDGGVNVPHEKRLEDQLSFTVDDSDRESNVSYVVDGDKNVEEERIATRRSKTTSIGDDFYMNDKNENLIDFSALRDENEIIKNELKTIRSQLLECNRLKAEKEKQNIDLLLIIENLKVELETEKQKRKETEDELIVLKDFCQKNHNRIEESQNSGDSSVVKNLEEKISQLENELSDKIKFIRLQHQKMKDMKKSFENGDLLPLPLRRKGADNPLMGSNSDVYDTGSSSTDNSPKASRKIVESSNKMIVNANASIFNEISFQYLKNLVFKFITSSECEAQQLIKALSVLLKFSSDEEQVIRETLEWRMSWFKNLPIVGQGLKPSSLTGK